MKKSIIAVLLIMLILCLFGCYDETAVADNEVSDTASKAESKIIEESSVNSEAAAPVKENGGDFNFELKDGKVIFTDYGLCYRAYLPKDERFIYQFQYDDVGMNEGASYGRETLRIYFLEEGQPMDRNIIEIISTPAGTREYESFVKTGLVYLDEDEKDYYFINESPDGTKFLHENTLNKHCIKADLTNEAYNELKPVLEDMMRNTKWYG